MTQELWRGPLNSVVCKKPLEIQSRLVPAIRLKAGLSEGTKRQQVSISKKGRATSVFLQGFYPVSDVPHTTVKWFYKGIQTLPLKLIWRSVFRLHWFIENKALHKKDPNHSSGTYHTFLLNFIVKSSMKIFLFSIFLKSTHLTLKENNSTRKRSRWVSNIPVQSYTTNASSWASKTPTNVKHSLPSFSVCHKNWL